MGSTPPAGLRGRPGRGAGWQAAHKERVSGEEPNLAAASSSGVRAPPRLGAEVAAGSLRSSSSSSSVGGCRSRNHTHVTAPVLFCPLVVRSETAFSESGLPTPGASSLAERALTDPAA